MKKKNESYSFRNSRKNIGAILGDNKKYLMPVVFVLAVVLTVVIALNANHRKVDQTELSAEATQEATYEVPQDETMGENAYPEVNALIEKYYAASASGDRETISSIYKGLEETELLKAVATSEYIDEFQNITVYTKRGPVADSYVAYVYNEVKLLDYEKAIPGLDSMYICTDENGELYINGDIADANEIEYLSEINLQADVIDLNNKIATRYNEMVSSDEQLAELLTRMREEIQVAVGEELAKSESAQNDSAEQGEGNENEQSQDSEASEAGAEVTTKTTVVTTRTIKATDVINIRKSDSETADVLSKTQRGDEFKELEALANGWSKIEYNGGVAYVKTEFFEVVGEEQEVIEEEELTVIQDADTGKMVLTDNVRLRSKPNTDSEVLVVISQKDSVKVVEQYTNGWAKVEYGDKTGYMKSEYLSKK